MSTIVTSKEDRTLSRLLSHMATVRERWREVNWMKEALMEDDSLKFLEVWMDLDQATQIKLWAAPKYGGVWTTREREKIRQWESEVRR